MSPSKSTTSYRTPEYYLVIIYAAGFTFSVDLVGSIYGQELVALISILILAPVATFQRYPDLQHVIVAYLIILVGLVISDIYNNVVFDFVEKSLKGWANLAFACVNVLFVVSILRKAPITLALLFLVASSVFQGLFGSGAISVTGVGVGATAADVTNDPNLFKVLIVPALLPIVVVSVHILARNRRHIAFLLGLSVAGILFSFDARSSAMIMFLTTVVGLSSAPLVSIRPAKLILFGISTVILTYIALVMYITVTLSGDLTGHNARQLAQLDNPYDPIALVAVGRSEWMVAGTAIKERPVMGYGSWPLDEGKHLTYLQAKLAGKEHLYEQLWRTDRAWIPTHSVMLTAWIWGGAIGFVGALILFWKVCSLTVKAFIRTNNGRVLTTFFGLTLFWDILFSPIGVLRLSFPVALAFLITIQASKRIGRLR